MKTYLLLFRLEGCPYCQRVESILDKKGIKYKKIEVPRDKKDRTLLKQLSDQDSVPILLNVIGSDSQDDDILEWLESNSL